MFGKWHLGDDPRHHPSAQGFDQALSTAGRHFNFTTSPSVEHAEDEYLADFLTDRALDYIDEHRDEPFFLYVSHFAVHSPHHAKPELIDRFRPKPAAGGHHDPTYAAMIASVDESVGRVLDRLDELQLSENTLVIFSSDNGGVGGYEREGIQGGSITDNAPLKGGKGMLYEGGVRVPYIFRWSGTIQPGTESNVPVNSVDLYPTLVELAGAEPPQDHTLDGTSYAGVLRGRPAEGERPPLFWHFPGYLGAGRNTWRTTPVGAVRSGDWKLLEFFEDGRLELYNLRDDPGEQHDLASQEPDRAGELHAMLKTWRSDIAAPMPQPNLPIR